MEIDLRITSGGGVYDAKSLASKITLNLQMGDVPGKLEVWIQKDPMDGNFTILNGATVALAVDKVNMFFGYVFTVKVDQNGVQKLTCYDQKRYLKNQDTQITKDMTASEIFTKLCNECNVKGTVKTPSSFVPPPRIHDTKTYYEMIYYAIQLCNANEGKQYFIKDNFGKLEFTELEAEKTNAVIAPKSLLLSYDYATSIDYDTYNVVKILREGKDKEKRQSFTSSGGEDKWGRLQCFKKVEESMNQAQIKQLASSILKLKNRETKSLKLSALGVPLLGEGSGFLLSIKEIGLNEFVWIKAINHYIEHNYHKMDLEVFM